MKMHELVNDEEMSTWPMPPALVAQVIRLVMKSGSVELFKKVKLLKVRPRVLLGLGRMYLEQGMESVHRLLQRCCMQSARGA